MTQRWWEVPYYWAGAKVYDLVASFHKSVPSSYYIGRCVTPANNLAWRKEKEWPSLMSLMLCL